MRFFKILGVGLVLYGLAHWVTFCMRPDNGIHTVEGSKNVLLLEGECVMFNWNATPREAELALEKWWKLRNK